MRWALVAAALLLSTAPGAALGDDATAALPPPPLVLTLAPGSGGGPWKMKVENTGEVPVRIAADAMLLSLEVTPPAGSAAAAALVKKGAKAGDPVVAKCELPADARPTTDEGRELVVPGKRSFTLSFDPLFYCFAPKDRGALVTGASVSARFGFPTPAAKTIKGKVESPAPPFVAAPVGAAVGRVRPVKAIESAAVALTETVTIAPAASPSSSPSGLVVSVPESIDALRSSELGVTVTLTNSSDHSITSLFRPELIRFSVSGPAGTMSCGQPRAVASPIRELFSTLAPKRRASVALLLTSLCDADTFDEAGIYRATPTFDSTEASGQPIGLRSWDGVATAGAPLLLRVRTSKRLLTTARPALD